MACKLNLHNQFACVSFFGYQEQRHLQSTLEARRKQATPALSVCLCVFLSVSIRQEMAPTHADVPQEHELELVHVAVLFRHGDRSPITRTIGSRLGMNVKETEF